MHLEFAYRSAYVTNVNCSTNIYILKMLKYLIVEWVLYKVLSFFFFVRVNWWSILVGSSLTSVKCPYRSRMWSWMDSLGWDTGSALLTWGRRLLRYVQSCVLCSKPVIHKPCPTDDFIGQLHHTVTCQEKFMDSEISCMDLFVTNSNAVYQDVLPMLY